MTNEHEFEIPRGNILPKIRQTLTTAGAVNLTGATVKFTYSRPDVDTVERDAVMVSASPSEDAATSFVVEYGWVEEDTAEAAVFNFQWKITLSGVEAPLNLPSRAPSNENPNRVFQTFEVVEAL